MLVAVVATSDEISTSWDEDVLVGTTDETLKPPSNELLDRGAELEDEASVEVLKEGSGDGTLV